MSTHPSKDRASPCSFSFADGRRCRTPRCSGHPHLCYFHARKEAQALAAQQVGRDISSYLSNSYLSACDLSSALGHVFSAVAPGQIKPKTATTLAYLGQTLVQSIHVAQHEYINAFGSDSWRHVIRASFARLPRTTNLTTTLTRTRTLTRTQTRTSNPKPNRTLSPASRHHPNSHL